MKKYKSKIKIIFSATLILIFFSSLICRADGPAYPIKASTDGRYLVDQNGAPFLMTGDAPHSIFANLSEADAELYFANRQSHGINALWSEMLCDTYTNCRSDGSTYDGIRPFTTGSSPANFDMSTPNPAYFQRIDNMINAAANHGLTIVLDSFETGGWMNMAEHNGATKVHNYGVYLGNRYKNFPNIIWIMGNDFQTWNSSSTDNNLMMNLMSGIASADHNHLQTTELNYELSGSLDDSLLLPYTTLAGAYTYTPTYDEVLHEYNAATNLTNPVPVFLEEEHYENENVGGCCGEGGTPNILRRQGYWTVLSGGLAGQMYGNMYTWTFTNGWKNNLDTIGVTQMNFWKSFFMSKAWYNLVPDQDHSVVTAGYGTYNNQGALGSNNYVTTARTADGTLVLSYVPVSHTLTVNMAKLAGQTTARWYDPTNNTYTSISGSSFANSGSHNFSTPGNNSAGDGDWVLVLESNGSADTTAPASPVNLTVH